MLDCLLTATFILVITVVAIVMLGYRDHNRARREQMRRPIQDRIQEIRDHASYSIRQLTQLYECHPEHRETGLIWIPVLLSYYRRLEALATEPNASPEAARQLALESSEYVKEHQIKGVFIGHFATSLSELLTEQGRLPRRPIS